MPAKQALGGQGLVKVAGGVQHHVHHAVHMPVAGCQGSNIEPQLAGHGGAHGVQVQPLAFNGAGGDDFLRQHLQGGLVPLRQPQRCHAPGQHALCAVHLRQRRGQGCGIKSQVRPIGQLPEVAGRAGGAVGAHAVIMRVIRRKICGE